MGDARLDYNDIMFAFFDKFLKGEGGQILDTMPKVRYYTMGLNKWQSSDTWPPRGAEPMTFYLSSGGSANTLNGDGVLSKTAPASDKPDKFTYDPMHPVMSHGGNVCCQGERGRRRRDGSARDGGAARRTRVHERTVHAGD